MGEYQVHFEAAVRLTNEAEAHLRIINKRLRSSFGDDFTLFNQGGDGWVILFGEESYNAPIKPTELENLLSMRKAKAVVFLKRKIGYV
jgi:hypothetical protein